ncbi:hypothetical protein ACFL30_00515 [Candidatus Latescibacterota bacterium]
MHARTFFITTACLLLILTAGCNIFDFSDKDEISASEKAEIYIRQGDFNRAKINLSEAVKDSVDSIILYLYAKAILLDGGFDIAELVSNISVQDPVPGLKLTILQLIDEFRDTDKTKWFTSNIEVAVLLKRIWQEKTTGMFTKNDIIIDYIIANMMTGILKIRDPNSDYIIDYRDFEIDMVFIKKTTGYMKSGFKIDGAKIKDLSGDIVVNDLGLPVILDGLTVFLGNWGSLTPGVDVHYQPNDINTWISNILKSFNTTDTLIKDYIDNNIDSSFDIEELKKYNSQLTESLNNYWYNDGIDNDGDGSIDEEDLNGIDDDFDGLVDEDTAYYPVTPPMSESKTSH